MVSDNSKQQRCSEIHRVAEGFEWLRRFEYGPITLEKVKLFKNRLSV
jgi:hypothetical protein